MIVEATTDNQSLLFAPGRIGRVALKNRLVMPPMTTRLADAKGMVTDAQLAYYQVRAEGGVGLVTVEMASVESAGKHRAFELGIRDETYLPGLTRLAATIHEAGAKASIQIGHAGGHTRADISGASPVAPSALAHFVFEVTGETIVPEALSEPRIAEVIKAFADAADRAGRAGFDCVEIHGAHGYLLSQFLCPVENVRTDLYGGSLRNRARFALEVVDAVRRALPNTALIYRMSADDLFPGGLTSEEGLQLASWIQEAGVDALHVSAGHYRSLPSPDIISAPMVYADAPLLKYAQAIKAIATVPVIAVGRLGNPAIAKSVVDGGSADFVSLGRTLVADPGWPDKVRKGLAVRPCLACNTCANEMRAGAKMGCVVNPAAARELEYPGTIDGNRKRIAVIGAGPAGLTFAHLAAMSHEVVVFEREVVAGGAFAWAGKAPMFQDVEAEESSFTWYASQMVAACRERGVAFRLNTDATKHLAEIAAFDEIVIATGAQYRWRLGPFARALLSSGAAKAWPLRNLLSIPRVRNWFYYQARTANGEALARRLPDMARVSMIGDALKAGKSQEAITSAFHRAQI